MTYKLHKAEWRANKLSTQLAEEMGINDRIKGKERKWFEGCLI